MSDGYGEEREGSLRREKSGAIGVKGGGQGEGTKCKRDGERGEEVQAGCKRFVQRAEVSCERDGKVGV